MQRHVAGFYQDAERDAVLRAVVDASSLPGLELGDRFAVLFGKD